jgi:hypothetical protein
MVGGFGPFPPAPSYPFWVWGGDVGARNLWRWSAWGFEGVVLDDLDAAAGAAFAVDHLAALGGAHSGAEADFAGAFYFADLVRVMHCEFLSFTSVPVSYFASCPCFAEASFASVLTIMLCSAWLPRLSVARIVT